jgi:hypothetical protein
VPASIKHILSGTYITLFKPTQKYEDSLLQ